MRGRTQDAILQVRMFKEELAKVQALAESCGKTVSELTRDLLLAAADQALANKPLKRAKQPTKRRKTPFDIFA